ncbi:Fur family transcriptional regulator [Cellulomonas chengniuliangii]|uniref:Transcriptional repressor n=1 Tax=Cellulomonas chengniuliangii TaxID=2968084 RepID=A0ABY5KTS7_9CELL|nr:transcriptional repressor [Cellulomonas chengniuliangii]MCC2308506.1 transcriptional repressor [Cellulomonas chengniuliangii]MCC2317523.1 transcriptional repressor [Cellulomonas chengniuliangii]UUI73872.1 transcriptional repressor [Cellulomonas chengniuliangii]
MTVVQRNTRQRAEVIALLDGLDEFRSAQQLHELLRARGSSVGLATVYRAVQTLSESGEVDVLRSPDGEAVYRRCERRSHHHHLVCRHCGRAVEIDGPGTEAWADQVAASHDFADVEHTIELVGTCAECRAAEAEARARASAELAAPPAPEGRA